MKNLKITLSIAALFIASHSVQATELQEQNAPTNQQALYQLELQSIDPSALQPANFILCDPWPDCGGIDLKSLDFISSPQSNQTADEPAQQ